MEKPNAVRDLETKNRNLKGALRECLKAMERNGWQYKDRGADADHEAWKLAKKIMKGSTNAGA